MSEEEEYQSQLLAHAARRGLSAASGEGNQWIFTHEASGKKGVVEYRPTLGNKKSYLIYAKGVLTSVRNSGDRQLALNARTSVQDETDSLDVEIARDVIFKVKFLGGLNIISLPKSDDELKELASSMQCINCQSPVDRAVLYCSNFCGQFAKTLRYGAKGIFENREEDVEFLIGFGQKLVALIKGGYPARARFLTKAEREFVFSRDNYTCQKCGAVAEQVDHINGSSRDPKNLRALCAACNREMALKAVTRSTRKDQDEPDVLDDLVLRLVGSTPSRFCDEFQVWPDLWPEIMKLRRKAVSGALY